MANTYWDTHGYSRIFNTSWEDQSGSADGDVSGWTIGNQFILVSQVYSNADACNKDCDGAQFKLQFENTTDSPGSWTDVGSATQISWGSGVVTDDAAGSQRLTGDTLSFCSNGYQQAFVNEGDNTLPDSGTLTGGGEYWTELQWVLSSSNALENKQYHFRIIDVTNTVTLGRSSGFDANGPGITMAGVQTYTEITDLDALLKKTLTETTELEAILFKRVLETTVFESILKKKYTETTDLQALLSANVQVVSSLDSYLKSVGIELSSIIDSVLSKNYSETSQLNAILQGAETLESFIDAILFEVGSVTIESAFEAILSKAYTIIGCLDASIRPIIGTVCWGHDTGVTEAHTRDFSGNWSGTGSIGGSGDAETITLTSGQNMESEVVEVGTNRIQIQLDKYDTGSGGPATVEYKDGDTESNCEADDWNAYSEPFTSTGFVKVRVSST